MKVRSRHVSFVLTLISILLVAACDPGIHYEPSGWDKTSRGRWVKSYGLIEIETGDMGGLIGETWLDPEISLRNLGKSPAIIESAILKTEDAEYPARSPQYEWGKWEVAGGENKRLDLEWEFERAKPIYKVLKGSVEIILRIKVGDERIEVKIPMAKSE